MGPPDLFRRVVEALEGAVASSYYGVPRSTNDMDIVVHLRRSDMLAIQVAFSDERYYLSEESMRIAMTRGGPFNLIDSMSGLKIDFVVPQDTEYDAGRFERARRGTLAPGISAVFASPDDVVIKKLQFYSQGGSDKHLRDIAAMLTVRDSEVDRDFVSTWALRLGVADVWQAVLGRIEQAGSGDAE